MPIYCFQCKNCNHEYEELTQYDSTGKYSKIKCPECDSKKKTQLMTTCNFKFSNPVGTDRWTSDSSGHDYRFKTHAPTVKKQRQVAEQMSHMGSDPYGDTSAADIDLDVGIHDLSLIHI